MFAVPLSQSRRWPVATLRLGVPVFAGQRLYRPFSVLLVGATAATAVLLPGLPSVAAADDEMSTGDTVVGTLVQAWPEYEDRAEAAEHGDEGPLSWVEPDDGDAVRIASEDVEHLAAGATIEVRLGDEVTDPAAGEGLEPAREVLAAEVLQPAPTPPPVARALPPGWITNRVTVAMVVPAGGVRDSTTLAEVVTAVNDPVADFWSRESRTGLGVGVAAQHDWPATPYTVSCANPTALWDEAQRKTGFVPGPGKHLLIYVPQSSPGCVYGLAEMREGRDSGGRLYVTDTATSLIAHELGHNFGLGHSSALQCNGSVDGRFCRVLGYGDYYDVMGASWDEVGSLNAPQAAALGFLRPWTPQWEGYLEVPIGGPSEQRLHRYWQQNTNFRALKLTGADDGAVYWLEYRTQEGPDAWLGDSSRNLAGLQDGVLLHREPTDADPTYGDDGSFLLDGTPSAPAGWDTDLETALPLGTPIRVEDGGFTLTLQRSTPGEIDVLVEANAPTGDARCQGRSRPTAPMNGVAFLTNAGGTAAMAVGSDRAVWTRPIDGGVAGWRSLGGGSLYGPAATTAGPASYVFVVGTDQSLWYRVDSGGGWSTWRPLGGRLTSTPAAASLGEGHVRVFGRGGDGTMWSREFLNGAWSAWTGHGGYLSSPPTATADPSRQRIEVDVRGGDGYVYKQFLTAGATAGTYTRRAVALCSALVLGPARAATDPADGAYLDGVGVPQLLDGPVSRSLGGRLTATPAVRFEGGDVLLAGRGGDSALWLYDGRPGGNGWVSLGGSLR
ncbi:MAG TPA: hypothetical protein VIH08_12300 [Blastococcus sp.]